MDDTFVETLEGLLGGDLASTNGANLDEAVDGAVEEGMAHVYGQVQSRRRQAAGEATVRHCLPSPLDAAAAAIYM